MRRGGGEDILFGTTLPLEGFLLCPWKFQTKLGFVLGKSTKLGYSRKKNKQQGFPNSGKGWGEGGQGGSEILLGEFLPGEGNLRSDFENANLFQS